MNLSKLQIGTVLTALGMLIGAAVYLIEVGATLKNYVSRIESLDRGTSINYEKQTAIAEINKTIRDASLPLLPTGAIIPFFGSEKSRPKK